VSIERINAGDLGQPPGYSHVVAASGTRLITTAGAVPLDAERVCENVTADHLTPVSSVAIVRANRCRLLA